MINMCELISRSSNLSSQVNPFTKKSNKTLEFHAVWFIQESRTQRNARIYLLQECIFDAFFREENRVTYDIWTVVGNTGTMLYSAFFPVCMYFHSILKIKTKG